MCCTPPLNYHIKILLRLILNFQYLEKLDFYDLFVVQNSDLE